MSAPSQTRPIEMARTTVTSRGPLERVRSLDERLLDAALLTCLVIGATCLYTIYALRVGSFQPDEWYYMELARTIETHFPSGLWQAGIYWRGIQRLDQLVLAAPFALLRGASVYEAAHVIQALLFASTAIPVWLLARAAGLARWARALAATIVLAIPWAIVSTSFLTESAAYPAYAWVLYTTWLAARAPGRKHELLAIAALILAALSRTALLAMTPILPLALLWQTSRWELRKRPWRGTLRALPGRLWSRHPIASAITVLGVAAYLVSVAGLLPGGGVASLTGNYGLPKQEALNGLIERYDYYLSRVVVGTGWIAMVLGIAWALRVLARPRNGALHALAVVSALGVGVMLLSLLQAGTDERYVVYGAVPVALAFAAELDCHWRRAGVVRPPSLIAHAISVAVAAAIVIVIFTKASWMPALSEYDFFTYPAATFYARVALTRLTSLPSGFTPADLVDLAIALVSIGWVAAVGARRTRRVASATTALVVLALCTTELVYSLEKFTTSPAAAADGSSAVKRSWLERIVPPNADVAVAGIGLGQTASFIPIWRTAEFWNTSIQVGVGFAPWEIPTLPFDGVGRTIMATGPSGRLHVASTAVGEAGRPASLPRYMLIPRESSNPVGFASTPVASDPLLPIDLVRLARPARLEWSLAGTSEEGFMAPGKPAIATVYEGALSDARPLCASFALIAPATFSGPKFAGSWPYTIASGSREVLRGRLVGEQTLPMQVRLYPSAVKGGRLATVTIIVHGEAKYVNGDYVSARVADFTLGACKRIG